MSILPILRGIRSFAGIQLTLAEAFAFFFYWLTINKIRGNIIDASFSTPNRTEARISYPAAGEIGLSNQKMLVTFDPSTISRSDVPLSRQKKNRKNEAAAAAFRWPFRLVRIIHFHASAVSFRNWNSTRRIQHTTFDIDRSNHGSLRRRIAKIQNSDSTLRPLKIIFSTTKSWMVVIRSYQMT